jgi:isoprenylcysteine carboxyl methyltransferase (ICMT) family protein YpbQ
MIQYKYRKAQSTLEMTLALIISFILLFAAVNFFFWTNKIMVLQNTNYENTRIEAGGNYSLGKQVDYLNNPKFKIFGGD